MCIVKLVDPNQMSGAQFVFDADIHQKKDFLPTVGGASSSRFNDFDYREEDLPPTLVGISLS